MQTVSTFYVKHVVPWPKLTVMQRSVLRKFIPQYGVTCVFNIMYKKWKMTECIYWKNKKPAKESYTHYCHLRKPLLKATGPWLRPVMPFILTGNFSFNGQKNYHFGHFRPFWMGALSKWWPLGNFKSLAKALASGTLNTGCQIWSQITLIFVFGLWCIQVSQCTTMVIT